MRQTSRQRAPERAIASDTLAWLPHLMGGQQIYEPPHGSVGFGYIARRLLRLATLPGDPR
jgi:hypothetical protein